MDGSHDAGGNFLEPSIERYLFILKVIFMTLVITTVVRTREEIAGLVWVIVASMSFYGIKGGLLHHTQRRWRSRLGASRQCDRG